MGLFTGIGRLIQGKPIFEEDDGVAIHKSGLSAAPHLENQAGEDQPDGIIKNSPTTFPVVRIEEYKADPEGHELIIRGMIKNDWHGQVIVQTVKAFGKQQTIGTWLGPEQAKEVVLYKGPKFASQPGYEILVDYKTEHEGDYFEAVHDVRFSYNAYEKFYDVSNIQLRMPIRDIYG